MKVTKRELLRRIEALEEWRDYADEMLTALNHALPDPEHDAKCAENAVAVDASLERHAVRLGLKKPKLKQLDQSAFDHEFVTSHFHYAAINANGQSIFFSDNPKYNLELGIWYSTAGSTMPMLKGYDTTNWQNSLIERKELTGSDLCRAMLERGDKYVMCFVSGMSDAKADSIPKAITSFNSLTRQFRANHDIWRYAVPINNQGEPLTAADVGL